MRTEYSIKNIIASILSQILTLLAAFAVRTVFIRTLGAEYLGVNGLFADVLSMLSLAELGIGSAITYSLYKPIAAGDTDKIKALMHLFKKAYIVIGIAVSAIGLCCLPFLTLLIKGNTVIPHIRIIFLMFVFNNAASYFFNYRRFLIIAHQKSYVVIRITYLFTLVSSVLQTVVLLVFKSYIIMLALQIAVNLSQMAFISLKAGRMYPYLREKPPALSKSDFLIVTDNVKALVIYNFGGALVSGTDNLIISAFVGVIWVGLYSNYLLLVNAVCVLLSLIFNSITASVGNLNAVEDRNKKLSMFSVINFANFWLIGFCSVCFFVLLNPFVTAWLGKPFLLSDVNVFLIVLNFYLTGMMNTTWIYRSTMGLFVHGRYRPLISAVINLVFSIVLAQFIGITGVFLGTAITRITTNIWYDPYIIYKHGFKSSVLPYYKKYLFFTLAALCAGAVTSFLCSFLRLSPIVNVAAELILCAVIPNALFTLLYFKTNEFAYYGNLARRLLMHRSTR